MYGDRYSHLILIQPSAILYALNCSLVSDGGSNHLVILRSGLLEVYLIEGENEKTELFLITSYTLPPKVRRICCVSDLQTHRDLIVASSGEGLLYLAYDAVLKEMVVIARHTFNFPGGVQLLQSPKRNFVICWHSTGTMLLFHSTDPENYLIIRGLPTIHELVDMATTDYISRETLTDLGLPKESLLLGILWADSSHDMYSQIFSFVEPSISQPPVLKEVTKRIPVQSRFCFIRPFGKDGFLVVGPSALFTLSTKTLDVNPILHPCAAPASLSSPGNFKDIRHKVLYLHDKSGLLIELIAAEDPGHNSSPMPLMRCWGLISPSTHSVFLQPNVLFLCSYSSPSLLLYVDWNRCEHITFSTKGLEPGVSDVLEDHTHMGALGVSQQGVFAVGLEGANSRTEFVEPHTFKHLSASILAENSQLQSGIPVVLAQVTHKGPIVDICYVPTKPTSMFEYNYVKLETLLFSSKSSIKSSRDGQSCSSANLSDSMGYKRQTDRFSLAFMNSAPFSYVSTAEAANLTSLSDLVAWAFQRTRYSGVVQLETQAQNTLSGVPIFSEPAIYTISGFDSHGFINLYRNRISHNCTSSLHLPGLHSISEISPGLLLTKFYDRNHKKYGYVTFKYSYHKKAQLSIISQDPLNIDLYNSKIYKLRAYDEATDLHSSPRPAFILVVSAFVLSVLEIDVATGKIDRQVFSITIKDLLLNSPSSLDNAETTALRELPQTYFDTVTITCSAVSANGINIVSALSNGSLVTSRFSASTRSLEIIMFKKFTINNVFLPHSGIVTYNIYSVAVSDEGCVCVCCLGIPYIFLLDMLLHHVLEYSSSDILQVPPRISRSLPSCPTDSSLSSQLGKSNYTKLTKNAGEDNSLSSIIAGSMIQPSDDLTLFVRLNQGSETSLFQFAACPYSHSAALNISPPIDLKFLSSDCLVMISLDGVIHVYAIGKVQIDQQLYFVCDGITTTLFSNVQIMASYVLKRAQDLRETTATSDAELYISALEQCAIARIVITWQKSPCLSKSSDSTERSTKVTSNNNVVISHTSQRIAVSIELLNCTDIFSIILPLEQTNFSHSFSAPLDRRPLLDNGPEDQAKRDTMPERLFIVYNSITQELSLAARAHSTITCASRPVPGLPRRLAHLCYHGLLCVGIHTLQKLSTMKDPILEGEDNLKTIPSVVDMHKSMPADDANLRKDGNTVNMDSPIEHYIYNNITRTFDASFTELYKNTCTDSSILEALKPQNSYAALWFLTYDLRHVLAIQLPENANISALQYIPLRSDALPFIVVGYSLPSNESMDTEDGVVAVYKLGTKYVPEKAYLLESVASYLFKDNTICDIVPYTNHRIAVSLGSALVILALATESDLLQEGATHSISDFCSGYAIGKPLLSTSYQLLEVYCCNGPALLLKVSSVYSQIALLDMLKGVTLMSDTLELTRTSLERPRLIVQSQLLQRMIPACIYYMSTEGPMLVGDRAGYIHIIELHRTQGMKIVASRYVGEQVVAFTPMCKSGATAILEREEPSSAVSEFYFPILYVTIGGQMGVIMKMSAPCSAMLRAIENCMHQNYPSRILTDVPIDLNFISRYKELANEEKELVVANLLSAKFTDLTVGILTKIITSILYVSTPW